MWTLETLAPNSFSRIKRMIVINQWPHKRESTVYYYIHITYLYIYVDHLPFVVIDHVSLPNDLSNHEHQQNGQADY